MKRVASFLGFLSLIVVTSLAYEAATFQVDYATNNGVRASVSNRCSGKVVSIASDITSGYTGTVVVLTSAGVGSSLNNGSRVLYTNSAVTGHVVTNLASPVYLYGDAVYMTTVSPHTNDVFDIKSMIILEQP